MSLSSVAKRLLRVAMGSKTYSEEIAQAIDDATAGIVPAGSISETELATAVATKLGHGETAYGWGDHGAAGYEASADMAVDVPANESDPIVGAVTGVVKADGAGNISAASAGTDFMAAQPDTFTVGHNGATGVAGEITVNDGLNPGAGSTVTKAKIDIWDAKMPVVLAVGSLNLASGNPTDANMVTAFGAAADHDGEFGILTDSSDATKAYGCSSDGASWWYVAMTKGEGV